jgi:unsaturated rhamnogalacturonyl hydrolase
MISLALLIGLSVLLVQKTSDAPLSFMSRAQSFNQIVTSHNTLKIAWYDISKPKNKHTTTDFLIRGAVCFNDVPTTGSRMQVQFTHGADGQAQIPITVPSKARCNKENTNWLAFTVPFKLINCPPGLSVNILKGSEVLSSQPIIPPALLTDNPLVATVCGIKPSPFVIPTQVVPTTAPKLSDLIVKFHIQGELETGKELSFAAVSCADPDCADVDFLARGPNFTYFTFNKSSDKRDITHMLSRIYPGTDSKYVGLWYGYGALDLDPAVKVDMTGCTKTSRTRCRVPVSNTRNSTVDFTITLPGGAPTVQPSPIPEPPRVTETPPAPTQQVVTPMPPTAAPQTPEPPTAVPPTSVPTAMPSIPPDPVPFACPLLDEVVNKTMSMTTPDMTTWNWESGIALVGLMKTYEASPDPRILSYVESWMDREVPLFLEKMRTCKAAGTCYPRCSDTDGWWSKAEEDKGVLHPNHAGPGWALMMLYTHKQKPEYKKVLDELVSFVDVKTCRVGQYKKAIAHFPHQLWDDTLPMVVPLMALYGEYFSQPHYINKAVEEYATHAETLSPNGGLWHHGWDEIEGCRACAYWSRGNSWTMLTGAELLRAIPTNHPQRGYVILTLVAQAKAAAQYQDPTSKLWHTVMDEPSYFEEISGSSGIAAAFLQTKSLFTPAPEVSGPLMQQGYDALREICSRHVSVDGTVNNVSTGTGFPLASDGKEKYNSIPHDTIKPYGQGLFMFMASAANLPTTRPQGAGKLSDVRKADINGDGVINTMDLFLYYEYVGGSDVSSYSIMYDVNTDNKTNALDLSLLLIHLGEEVPAL